MPSGIISNTDFLCIIQFLQLKHSATRAWLFVGDRSVHLRFNPELWFQYSFYGSHISLFTISPSLPVYSFPYMVWPICRIRGINDEIHSVYFPIFLLGVFNRMPAGLTWYYTVSNVITLLIQFVIQT